MEADAYSVKNEGITIRDHQRDNLQIGWDEDDGFILLFTPDMDDTNIHYHVELTEDQALKLSEFLNKKLSELSRKRSRWSRAVEILKDAPDVEAEPHDKV